MGRPYILSHKRHTQKEAQTMLRTDPTTRNDLIKYINADPDKNAEMIAFAEALKGRPIADPATEDEIEYLDSIWN